MKNHALPLEVTLTPMKIPYPLKPSSMWQARLLLPPLFHLFADTMAMILAPTLFSGWYGQKPFWSQYIPEFTVATVGMYAITESNYWAYYVLDRVLPWERNNAKRLAFQMLFSLFFSVVAAFVVRWVMAQLHPGDDEAGVQTFVILTASTTFVLGVIFLGMFVFHRMSASLIEAEQLKRENLIAQNQALRQQIDPHFLFNSITTLTTLIEEDKTLAIDFVRRLANVYRYVLNSKEYDLVDLRTEIGLVRDYAFAFEMRFADHFHMTVNIPDEAMAFRIPPLTLQILVENAVKHNVVSREHPLNIQIGMEGNSKLIVRNNLQRKQASSSPTHVGLNNILARYKHVSEGIVEVIENEKEFIVKLPLVKP
jgi:two-component system LytT family sensor kinase